MVDPDFLMTWCNHPVAVFVVAVFLYMSYRIAKQHGDGGGDL